MRLKPGLPMRVLRALSEAALVAAMLGLFVVCPGCTVKPLDAVPSAGQD